MMIMPFSSKVIFGREDLKYGFGIQHRQEQTNGDGIRIDNDSQHLRSTTELLDNNEDHAFRSLVRLCSISWTPEVLMEMCCDCSPAAVVIAAV